MWVWVPVWGGEVFVALSSLGYITALIDTTLELLLPEAVTPPTPTHGMLDVHPLLRGPLESLATFDLVFQQLLSAREGSSVLLPCSLTKLLLWILLLLIL